jgi:PKD repeat protein
MVKAIKKAENSSEIVVRLQELTGQAQTAQLSCAGAITAARQLTGAEDPITTLTPSGGTLTVSLGAYQPITLALTIAAPGTLVSQPVSLPVTLPFNLDAISTDGNRTDGNFDGGYTYPAELFPGTIVRDGVTFQIGPTNNGALNALACQGQTITLTPGYDRLYLLAAAASNDVTAPFTVDGQVTNLTVRYFSGFIGQWNPPSLKKDEVGWACSHRHTSAGNNDAYRFCYLFKYRIDLPPGATSLVLPNSPNLRLFALSLAGNTTADTFAAGAPLVQNEAPWTVAGADRLLNAGTNGFATVTLDGSGSVDPDGTIVSYAWTRNGSPLATGIKPTVNLPLGTNVVALTVTDDMGATSQSFVNLIVLTPLNVSIIANPTSGSSAPLTVQFTGSASGGSSASADTTDDHLGTITAQGENSPSELATNAFDNNLSSKWLDFANAHTSTRSSWIQYQYSGGIQKLVTNYTITSANDAASYPARNPSAWRLMGSNNNGTNWTTLDTRTNQTFTASMQTLSWNPTNTGLYNVYRLTIDRVATPASANSVQLDEIQFNGPPAYSYFWSFGDGTTATGQSAQHTYTNPGNYLVILGVSYGIYTGTNYAVITVGSPLAGGLTATPPIGTTPLFVQFSSQAAGGNPSRPAFDTTEDQRGTVTAQGDNPPNETAPKVFDNNSATKWLDFANANPSTRSSWIQYQYANGLQCIVSQYALTTANDAPERDPLVWRLLASTDGGTTWATLDTQSVGLSTTRYYRTVFNIANPAAYNIYRLQVDTVANSVNGTATVANSVQLAEIELLGDPAYSYSWNFGDGATSTARNPRHTYTSLGTYTVTQTISDGVAQIINTTNVNVLPLTIALAPASTGNLKVTWPAWATNCSLYFATNLTAPVIWSPVTNPPVNSGGVLSVTLPTDGDNCFFQLRSP